MVRKTAAALAALFQLVALVGAANNLAAADLFRDVQAPPVSLHALTLNKNLQVYSPIRIT